MMYLKMKGLGRNARLSAAFLTLAFSLQPLANAGDKIIASDQKSQADPNKDLRFGSDFLKSRGKFDEPAFDPGILGIPTLPRLPLNHKEELKQKHKRDEQRNWLLLDQGELQRK